MRKKGYSRRGFWGQRIYFDKDGNKKGEAFRNFWGGKNYYDADGNKTGYSLRNFWGGYNRYDNDGNLVGRTYRNFWGGYDSYDKNNRRRSRSFKNFWGGYNHYEPDEAYHRENQNNYVAKSNNQTPQRRSTRSAQNTTTLKFSAKAKDTWKIHEIESISDNSELLKFLMKKKYSLDSQLSSAVSCDKQLESIYAFLWSYELYRCILRSDLTSSQQERIYSLLRKIFKTKTIDLQMYYKLDKYFDFNDRALFWKIIMGKCRVEGACDINSVTPSFFSEYFRFLVQFEIYLSRVFPGFGFGEHIVEEIQRDMIKLKEIISKAESEVVSNAEIEL